jgi:hypothetical protein
MKKAYIRHALYAFAIMCSPTLTEEVKTDKKTRHDSTLNILYFMIMNEIEKLAHTTKEDRIHGCFYSKLCDDLGLAKVALQKIPEIRTNCARINLKN